MKKEVDAQADKPAAAFVEACEAGDVATVRKMLGENPELVKAAHPGRPHGGWTGLHGAAQKGRLEVVRLLIERGADVNAREAGDNTYPLHWAAAEGNVEVVRALLDAGTDVHGLGDVHALDVIGWATYWRRGNIPTDVVSLLIERGARHHVFSAMSAGDVELVRQVIQRDPKALARRMSRFEKALSPLHFAMKEKRYDLLDVLIELSADLEAVNGDGNTAMAVAMLEGDQEAMRRLDRAGARRPRVVVTNNFARRMAEAGKLMKRVVPMIFVVDVAKSLEWYSSIGFKVLNRVEDGGLVNFGEIALGDVQIMLNMHGTPGNKPVSLWLYTDRIDRLYELLKSRQIEIATGSLGAASLDERAILFEEHLNEPFYGGKQFAIRDPNGFVIYFYEPG
jgi:ankyrin repeat protein